MKIIYGLCNNALLQRDENNECICEFEAECVGMLKVSVGRVEKCAENKYVLSGIPAGGPHSVIVSDDEDSVTLTLWVGDIWLLGGQSNMEGAGRFTNSDLSYEKSPNPDIRAYFSDNRWGEAVPMLHEPWLSVDACQREVWKKNQLESVWKSDQPEFIAYNLPKKGIGPGLFFAKKMYEITTGIPQALVPCALGGSSLSDWNPDSKEDNLYHAMIRRVKRVGSRVSGLFWYQGCSETGTEDAEKFTERMINLVKSVRRDVNNEKLPFVQVQIAGNNLPGCNSLIAGLMWEKVREQQRILSEHIENMDTVSAIDSELDDLIHLSGTAQAQIGMRGALSMAKLCGIGGNVAPKLVSMEIRPDECRPFSGVVAIKYENIQNLISVGSPLGFTLTESEDEFLLMPSMRIARTVLDGDTVLLYTEIAPEDLPRYYIRYGYLNMGHCSIGDETGHHLLAMGPLKISDFLN